MKRVFYKKNKFIDIAEGVEDLTQLQYIQLAGLLSQDIDDVVARVAALKIVSNKKWIPFLLLSAEVKVHCLEHIEWCFGSLNVIQNKIQKYKGFYGVADRLENMELIEFHYAEHYYAQIKEDDAALSKLIAVLYRPAKRHYDLKRDPEGDPREAFNSNLIDYYAEQIDKKWSEFAKMGVLMFYDGCRALLEKEYPEVFGGPEEAGGEDVGMYQIIRRLAGDKFGDIEKVEKMLLHNALLELCLITREDEEMKRKYKSS